MKKKYNEYEMDDQRSRIQLDVVHGLLKNTYWAKEIPYKTVAASVESSLCFGVYREEAQVGFARVVTDQATFAWICDVIIDEKHRGQKISVELMKFILSHPNLQGLRRICLATKDAHGLYEKFGFKVTETPKNWMEIKDSEIYQKLSTFR